MKKKLQLLRSAQGFTLLEILMVLLLIAILAAVGITAFVNYTKETRNAATKANLQILRNGIAAEYGKAQLDCNDVKGYWPCVSAVAGNDITTVWNATTDVDCPEYSYDTGSGGPDQGSICTTTQIPTSTDRQFANGGTGIPVNPWGYSGTSNAVYDCELVSASCVRTANLNCNTGVAYGTTASSDDGWCYDSHTGMFWANSENNGYPTSPSTTGFEESY